MATSAAALELSNDAGDKSKHVSQAINLLNTGEGPAGGDEDDDDKGMLNDFEVGSLNPSDGEEDKEEDAAGDELFGLGEDHATLNRVTKNFKIAKSRA